MGTKNNPGKFDCYARLDPDEPHFVLMGRDPVAGVLVQFWVELRQAIGNVDDPDKLDEALACADAMTRWAAGLDKGDQIGLALAALRRRDLPDTEKMLREGFEKMNEAVAAHNAVQDRQAAASEKHAEAMQQIAAVLEQAVLAFVKGFTASFLAEFQKKQEEAGVEFVKVERVEVGHGG